MDQQQGEILLKKFMQGISILLALGYVLFVFFIFYIFYNVNKNILPALLNGQSVIGKVTEIKKELTASGRQQFTLLATFKNAEGTVVTKPVLNYSSVNMSYKVGDEIRLKFLKENNDKVIIATFGATIVQIVTFSISVIIVIVSGFFLFRYFKKTGIM